MRKTILVRLRSLRESRTTLSFVSPPRTDAGSSRRNPWLQYNPKTQDIGLLSVMVNADQIITGSVRKNAEHVRVSVTGVHPSGLETWSERIDFSANGSDLLVLEEQTASALMARIAPQESVLRGMQARVPSVCLAEFPEMISAEELLDKGTSSSIRGALKRFNNLARRLSASARIQCGIVQCHYALALLGENSPPAYVRKAKELLSERYSSIRRWAKLMPQWDVPWRWSIGGTVQRRPFMLLS